MDAEIVSDKCVLTLSRSEVVLLVSIMVALDSTLASDISFRDRVGSDRAEVSALADRLADLGRSIPTKA